MSAVLADLDLPSPWRRTAPVLAALCLAALLLYRDTAWSMVEIWSRSETFTHAFLVPPIVAWLIWRDRARIRACVPKPAPWVLLPMAGAALLWVAGELLFANALSQFAFTALLVLIVPAVAGLAVARAMAFPLLFAFFAVPVGEFMLPVLMSTTADFTVAALRLTGVPVYREGQQFMIPTGNWSVVEACSGVRYLIASAMVGTLFSYLNFRGLRRRLLFVGFALGLPIVANWLRAYLIVMLGHLSGNRIAVGVDHLIYGWVFFGAVMLLMFMLGARWADANGPQPAPSLAARPVPPLPSLGWGWPAITAVLLALPPLALSTAASPSPASVDVRLSAVEVPGWREVDAEPGFRPVFVGAAATRLTGYERDGRRVSVYFARYQHQDRERKLASSVNTIVTSEDERWVVTDVSRRDGAIPWQETRLRTRPVFVQEASRVAWRLYLVDGAWVASDAQARLRLALQRLAGRGDDSAAVVLWAEDDATLQGFLADARVPLERLLTPASRP